jgi:hypothetical protein
MSQEYFYRKYRPPEQRIFGGANVGIKFFPNNFSKALNFGKVINKILKSLPVNRWEGFFRKTNSQQIVNKYISEQIKSCCLFINFAGNFTELCHTDVYRQQTKQGRERWKPPYKKWNSKTEKLLFQQNQSKIFKS